MVEAVNHPAFLQNEMKMAMPKQSGDTVHNTDGKPIQDPHLSFLIRLSTWVTYFVTALLQHCHLHAKLHGYCYNWTASFAMRLTHHDILGLPCSFQKATAVLMLYLDME